MHTYTKKYIDNLVFKAVYYKCSVPCIQLSKEDIDNYKSSLPENKDDSLPENKDDSLPENKDDSLPENKDDSLPENKDDTLKEDGPVKKRPKLDTNGLDVLKLVLSREGETDKFKSQFKSSLKPNKEIVSTSNEDVQMEIDSEISPDLTNSAANNLYGKIQLIDPKKMMSEDMYKRFLCMFADLKSKPTNGVKKSANSVKLSSNGPKVSLHSTKVNGVKLPFNGKNNIKGNLTEIEKLYKKYFSKTVQDTIVTIANILNIISMSNKHHKARMDESFKKRSEAEKLKERCDANRLHTRHKTILETKLKINFMKVVSTFLESEFESAFQMFFLSILTVLRVLDQPKFKKGSIFKNLVLLLWNSLKNSEFDHPKVFSMFRSKTFRPDCIDLISLIEDSRDIDAGITDRMTLFFVSTVNSREYFQAVIDAVTSDSNEDLSALIDSASHQCCVNSKFKDPIVSSTDDIIDDITPTVQGPSNSDETVQHWVITKNSDGTFQQLPLKNGNTTVEPPITMSQPLNNFYESFSSSLQRKVSSDSFTSKVMPTKKRVVVTSTIANNSLVQGTSTLSETTTITTTTTTATLVTLKPTIQNNSPIATNPLLRAEGSTIFVGNRQYQLVKGPSGQMRAVVNGTNILVKSPTTTIKCYAKNCSDPATIMCSSCTSVKYCSHTCQRQDWYENHINNCERLLKLKLTRS